MWGARDYPAALALPAVAYRALEIPPAVDAKTGRLTADSYPGVRRMSRATTSMLPTAKSDLWMVHRRRRDLLMSTKIRFTLTTGCRRIGRTEPTVGRPIRSRALEPELMHVFGEPSGRAADAGYQHRLKDPGGLHRITGRSRGALFDTPAGGSGARPILTTEESPGHLFLVLHRIPCYTRDRGPG